MTPTQPKHTTTEVSEAMVNRALDAADYCRNPDTAKWMRAALEAALSPRDGVPGMVLVPREPNEAMIEAGVTADTGKTLGERVTNCYRAMLSTASIPKGDGL